MNPFTTHGAVSWSEHLAPDPAASLEFYTKLLGWTHYTMAMEVEGGGTYYVALATGVNAAGFMKRPHDDVPPCWGFYVTVKDVRALVAAHKPTLCIPVTNTPMGPFCGIVDPQGAVIYAIEYAAPEKESGGVTEFASTFRTHGLFSWFELHTSDGAAAAEFYGRIFGWTFVEREIPSGIYRIITLGDVGIGGIAEYMPDNTSPYWHGFITVDDVDARTSLADSLQATIAAPAFDLPGVGRMAHIHDPDGAPLTLIKYEDFAG